MIPMGLGIVETVQSIAIDGHLSVNTYLWEVAVICAWGLCLAKGRPQPIYKSSQLLINGISQTGNFDGSANNNASARDDVLQTVRGF